MILLKYHTDHSVSIEIDGQNNDFYTTIKTIKDLPVRDYDKIAKEWVIPISDIIRFKKMINKKGLRFKCEESVKVAFREHLEWRQLQLSIKEIDYSGGDWDILKLDMYQFQKNGSQFLYTAENCLLLDHVGLGKTVQSLAVTERHFNEKNINFSIIICPSTLKKNWCMEIEKFTDRTYFIVSGDKYKRRKQYKNAYKYDFMIINYDLLHWDAETLDEYIFQRGYEYLLIMDEVQYIKNHTAKRSKISKQMAYRSKYSIGLSATVIENNVMDLWSVCHSINPHIFGGEKSYFHFMEYFAETDFFGNPVGYKHGKLIKSKMKPYSIRRFKEDVLTDLPERVENNIWIDLSKEQRGIYNEIKNNISTSLSDMEKAGRIQMADILPMITYLRQCVLSTGLVGSEAIYSTKTVELLNFLNSMDNSHKIVIFVHFIDMVEYLYDQLVQNGYKVMAMHGETTKRLGVKLDDRVPMINEFNKSEELQILVTSDILSVGVNITSASYLINMDLLFNPAKMEQRIGRIDRIGNESKKINIINIISNDTIEESIYKSAMIDKKNMSKDLIDDNKVEKRLTVKTIKSLLEIL